MAAHASHTHDADAPLGFFSQLAIAFHLGNEAFGEVAADPAHTWKVVCEVLIVGAAAGFVIGGGWSGGLVTTGLVLAAWLAMSIVALVVGRALGTRSPAWAEVVRGVGFACFPGIGVLFALVAGSDAPALRPAILGCVGAWAALTQIFAAHELFEVRWPRALAIGGIVALVGAIPFAAIAF